MMDRYYRTLITIPLGLGLLGLLGFRISLN